MTSQQYFQISSVSEMPSSDCQSNLGLEYTVWVDPYTEVYRRETNFIGVEERISIVKAGSSGGSNISSPYSARKEWRNL